MLGLFVFALWERLLRPAERVNEKKDTESEHSISIRRDYIE